MSRRRGGIQLRLAVATAALLFACVAGSLGAVYWSAKGAARRAVDRALEAELAPLLGRYAADGVAGLRAELPRRMAGGEADRGFLYLLVERSGSRLGNLAPPEGLEALEGLGSLVASGRELRLVRAPLAGGHALTVARDVSHGRLQERALLSATLAVVGLSVVAAIGSGLALSHGLLGRVERMNRTIVSILGGRREARVALTGKADEFEELARHFNLLLDENEALVARVRGVTDDIAHDLRTPLARLRGRVESALARAPGSGECAAVLEDVLHETDSLLATFQALLGIARIEDGAGLEQAAPVDLAELVRAAVELYEPVAEEAGGALVARAEEGLVLLGNRHLLAQALTNLIDNAVKFAAASGRIEVAAERSEGDLRLRVSDRGPGIPPEERERVLQRFVRLDRSRGAPGAGLGLSLVAAIARLHGARLELADGAPGLDVSLVFPAGRAERRG